MPNLANITLIGHLGGDPDVQYSSSGLTIAKFSLAHTFHRKNEDTTTWWQCTAFGKTAEIAAKYLVIGNAVCVIGTAYNEPWKDERGADKLTLRCMVDRIVLLGKRAEGVAPGTKADKAEDQTKPMPAWTKPTPGNPFADMEDDIF